MSQEAAHPHTAHHVDLRALLTESWGLFIDCAPTHVLVGAIVALAAVLTLGVAAAPLLIGYIRLIDRQIDGERPDVAELFVSMQAPGPAIVLYTIGLIACALAASLFVLPGLALALMWSLSPWYLALAEHQPMAALDASWKQVRRDPGLVLLVSALVAALNTVGILLIVGVVVTLPIGVIIGTLFYRAIRSDGQSPADLPA
jgi:uncharacterized membrane protein